MASGWGSNPITDEQEAAVKEVKKVYRELKPIYETGGLLAKDDIIGYLSNPEYSGKSENKEKIKALVDKARTFQELVATDEEVGPSVTEYIEYRLTLKEHADETAKQLFDFITKKDDPKDQMLLLILDRLDQRHKFINTGRAERKPKPGPDTQIKEIIDKLTLDNLDLVGTKLLEMVKNHNKLAASAAGGKRKTRKTRKTRKYSRRR